MIKFENTEVLGWDHAIRGMRNPKNSWDKSDSKLEKSHLETVLPEFDWRPVFNIGPNDRDLMRRLRDAGTDHRKFMRMIVVYVDITAPLYWWKEFDTYKVGTVANSCSTMHKIAAKEFTLDDFSHEHLLPNAKRHLEHTIAELNRYRDLYLYGGQDSLQDQEGTVMVFEPKDKRVWLQLIQLLPSSYNQKRTVMLNYEVLANIYKPTSRRHHKLDEWNVGCDGSFCKWIEELPHSYLITG